MLVLTTEVFMNTFIAFAIIFVLVCFYLHGRFEMQEKIKQQKLVDDLVDNVENLISGLIKKHQNVLYRKYKQTHYIDEYGKECTDGWDRELDYFIEHVIKPEIDEDNFRIKTNIVKFKIELAMLCIKNPDFANYLGNSKVKDTPYEYIEVNTGLEYENFIEEVLKEGDYVVIRTPKTGDQGVDLIAIKNDIRIAIQCKFYSKPVGNKAVQEVVAGKDYYECEYACVVSNNFFTPAAKKLASASNILLLNEDSIVEELNKITSDSTFDKTKHNNEDNDDEELLFTDLTDENDPMKIK